MTAVQRIVVADLGMGNLRSVVRALERATQDHGIPASVSLAADPAALRSADRIVVPGQGAFRDCAAALERGFGDAIKEALGKKIPYLGICLGLQALFDDSEEAPGKKGLGIFKGTVKRLCPVDAAAKIPHMGWNSIRTTAASSFEDGELYYFVHSYHAVPEDPSVVAAVTEHGGETVTAAIAFENITATQFHPEKSQAAGLRLLGRLLAARTAGSVCSPASS